MISVVAFGFAWWLGLYLLARDAAKPTLFRAGVGLLGYALALATTDLRTGPPLLAAVHAVFLSLPSVMWTGVFIAVFPNRPVLAAVWRWVLLPATPVLAAASPFVGKWSAGVVVLPLFTALGLVGRHGAEINRGRGMTFSYLLMLGLATSLLAFSISNRPPALVLPAIGVDLVLLGGCIAWLDAFDEGETIRRDMLWSLLVAGGTAVLFGSQVALAAWLVDRPLEPLAYGVVGAAIAVQVLARPINALADRFAFRDAPALRQERTELREVAAALPRRAEVPLAEFDDAEFVRLTRRALSHYGDLGKLASSPLTALPVVTARLADRDAPLARATELKAVLLETIMRLKPADGEFGTSEEWRHYNALYFYYVVGVRPYSVRTKLTGLDPVARRALAWFVDQVPERTLHNWQAAAARIVATELRLTSTWQ